MFTFALLMVFAMFLEIQNAHLPASRPVTGFEEIRDDSVIAYQG